MVIDYSKWDNIDTDSNDEPAGSPSEPANPPKPPAKQEAPVQPSQAPSTAGATPADDKSTGTERIKAVKQPESEAPLSAILGIPLVFRRLPISQFATSAWGLDNQIITYLNIDPESGLAPPAWQSRVGTVPVARRDKIPLLEQHLEGIWMYCDYILDIFGDAGEVLTRLYNRPAFEKWWARYAEEMRERREDWNNVPTPYEV